MKRPWVDLAATSRRARPQILLPLCALALLLSALPAQAFDKQKAASKMAEQALASYESGDYDRAAELYANAFSTDPDPNYLYAEARAEQVAGKLDRAVTHLEQVVANPNATPDRVAKAKELLQGLYAARLDKRVTEGESAARSGDYKLAAQIWLDVVKSSPKRVELYYRAGVSLQQAADSEGALAAFDAYLQQAGRDGQDRSQAKLRRDALYEKLHPKPTAVAEPERTKVAPPAERTVVKEPDNATGTVTARPQEGSSSTLGWVLAGSGVAIGLGGLAVYAATLADINAFNTATAKDANGKIAAVDLQTATAQHTSIQNREIAAIAMGGAGIALAGVGTWLALRTPEAKVVWTPGPTTAGAGLAWRF